MFSVDLGIGDTTAATPGADGWFDLRLDGMPQFTAARPVGANNMVFGPAPASAGAMIGLGIVAENAVNEGGSMTLAAGLSCPIQFVDVTASGGGGAFTINLDASVIVPPTGATFWIRVTTDGTTTCDFVCSAGGGIYTVAVSQDRTCIVVFTGTQWRLLSASDNA
jgi:hypothetical protein